MLGMCKGPLCKLVSPNISCAYHDCRFPSFAIIFEKECPNDEKLSIASYRIPTAIPITLQKGYGCAAFYSAAQCEVGMISETPDTEKGADAMIFQQVLAVHSFDLVSF